MAGLTGRVRLHVQTTLPTKVEEETAAAAEWTALVGGETLSTKSVRISDVGFEEEEEDESIQEAGEVQTMVISPYG